MTRKVLAALAVALAIASCPVQAQPPKEVNWGYPVQSAYFWDVFAAIDFGYMAEQGLKVNPIITQNVTQQMQMLVTNAVDIVSANTELVISAIDKGADLAIIAGETARQGYALIARPEINSYSDLKGKVLGITQLREASGTALELLLKKNGVNPGEYSVIPLGGTPNRFAALTRGAVAATMLSPPADFKALSQGMKRLGFGYEGLEAPQILFTIQRDWGKKNEDTLVRFLKATLKASRWLYDPKNKEAAANVLVKAIGGSHEDALMSYDYFFGQGRVAAHELEVTPAGIKAFLDLRNSEDKPEKYLDLSYLNKTLGK
jgi:NitT/TauT family transport system substrate-binding protein